MMRQNKKVWLLLVVGILAVWWGVGKWEKGTEAEQVKVGEQMMMLADCEVPALPASDVPMVWWESEIKGRVGKVYVQDGYAYLRVGDSTVVLDVLNPAEPKEVHYVPNLVPLALTEIRYIPYVDPTNSLHISCLDSREIKFNDRQDSGYTTMIFGADNIAYATDSARSVDQIVYEGATKDAIRPFWGFDQLVVYDVTDMANPVILDGYASWLIDKVRWVRNPGEIVPHIEHTQEAPRSVLTMALADDYLYLVEGTYLYDRGGGRIPYGVVRTGAGDERLTILDVSDPADIGFVSSYTFMEYKNAWKIIVKGTSVFIGGLGGTILVDVSNPKKPIETYQFQKGSLLGVHQQKAYFENEKRGVVVWDVSNPNNPIEASVLAFPHHEDSSHYVGDIVFKEDYAFVDFGKAGLHIFDMKDAVRPELVSVMEVPASFLPGLGNQIMDIEFVGGYMYVTFEASGLYIFDVSDVQQPKLVSKVMYEMLPNIDL